MVSTRGSRLAKVCGAARVPFCGRPPLDFAKGGPKNLQAPQGLTRRPEPREGARLYRSPVYALARGILGAPDPNSEVQRRWHDGPRSQHTTLALASLEGVEQQCR